MLLKSLGLRAHDVLSTKSPAFRANPFDPATKSENELIGLMIQEPRLIRRPLMAIEGKAVIGFDEEKLTEVLKK